MKVKDTNGNLFEAMEYTGANRREVFQFLGNATIHDYEGMYYTPQDFLMGYTKKGVIFVKFGERMVEGMLPEKFHRMYKEIETEGDSQ